jgi:hypothetical protein
MGPYSAHHGPSMGPSLVHIGPIFAPVAHVFAFLEGPRGPWHMCPWGPMCPHGPWGPIYTQQQWHMIWSSLDHCVSTKTANAPTAFSLLSVFGSLFVLLFSYVGSVFGCLCCFGMFWHCCCSGVLVWDYLSVVLGLRVPGFSWRWWCLPFVLPCLVQPCLVTST